MALLRERRRNSMVIRQLESIDLTMSNTYESMVEAASTTSTRPGPVVTSLSTFRNYSKVRASQKLSLKQKVKYWNTSMPQSKTGPSGTQKSNLTDFSDRKPVSMIGPQLLHLATGERTKDSGTFSFGSQFFDIDQKANDKCNNMFSKFASPTVPVLKPGGKQNWSWESLHPGSKEGESATETGTTIAVFSPKKAAHTVKAIFPAAMSETTGEESSSGSGTFISIFGPRKAAGTFPHFNNFPKQIRDMIWDEASNSLPPQAVIISIDFVQINKFRKTRPGDENSLIYRAKATCQIPAILHSCRDSRVVGLKRYSLAFKEQLCRRPVFFDYETDALLFDSKAAMAHFYGGTLVGGGFLAARGFRYDMNAVHRNVRHVAIASPNSYSTPALNPIGWSLNVWSRLKLVVLDNVQPSNFRGLTHRRAEALIGGRFTPPGAWSDLTARREPNKMPEICIPSYGERSSFSKVCAELERRGFWMKRRVAKTPYAW